MEGKKILAIICSLTLTLGIISGCSKGDSNKNDKVKIGLEQLIEHPALDSAREGFEERMKEKGYEDGKNIEYEYKNAQGDNAITQQIAQNFVSDKKDIIVSIATPAAQAAYNATKDIPIVFTAVTDPVAAELVKSLENPGTNVTGTSDDVSIEKQFQLLKTLVPKAKKIGMLYNTSEANSEVQVNKAKKASSDFQLEIIPKGITNVNEIDAALNSLLGEVDALYIPTDNTIANAAALVNKKAIEKKIPVIAAERGMVENGALATLGIDYKQLGRNTADVVIKIIEGEKPENIAVTTLKDMNLIVNTDTADALGITLPGDIDKKAEKIKGSN
ncbi:ABC transporter substrate-binding protein [Clostridium bornimense]|uniref:ABC transporter substrate-binding protein n=1 Tax=Clostridium bornimense TaxID=1216932 RepID=UPI001C0F63AC|nr:ABC transporter substrate-binding protein [Clostridium bornimense]MBU5316484.1 ABC transporter substrate-binding protein [Clostridium bornimense]